MNNDLIKASLLRQRADHWRKHEWVEGKMVAHDFDVAATCLEDADLRMIDLRAENDRLRQDHSFLMTLFNDRAQRIARLEDTVRAAIAMLVALFDDDEPTALP